MDNDYQFNIEVSFIEELFIDPLRPDESRLLNLTKTFDYTIFHMFKSRDYFLNSYKKYKNNSSFEELLEVSYHINYCIRLLGTINDLYKRIIVEYHLLNNPDSDFKRKDIFEYNDYISSKRKSDSSFDKEIKKFGTINNNTKNLRHIFTHEGSIMIVDNLIENNGMTSWYTSDSDIIKNKQSDLIDDYTDKIDRDIERIKNFMLNKKPDILEVFNEMVMFIDQKK